MVSEDLIKKIAANVSQRISSPDRASSSASANESQADLESVTRQLREIQSAVGKLERQLQSLAPHQHTHTLPVIAGTHPSQELFNVPEEVTEFVDYLETKQCVLEPGKPCCGRGECRSRGF